MSVAFLGPRGTFSEVAALERAGSEAATVPFTSFPAVVSAVETGLADEALVAVENSIEGPVPTTLDLLIHETPLRIRGEIVVPIRQFLVTVPGATIDGITVVVSHPQGLGQCRRFLERCLPDVEQVAALSTAGAVREAIASGDPRRAAIGHARAAELYGGVVLAHDIQDARSNVTRFLLLGREDAAPTGDDKTSIGFTVKANVPGALHAILTELANESIQMTKIENRPTKGWLGEYVFLVDFEGHRTDPRIGAMLERIRAVTDSLTVFGSYPRYPLERLRDAADPQPLA
ncbi:MAG: prephenate dehydratase [Thermomicrobiales bacterium]|nr:prephenate dehydratase [Thermomicrobiales bacterium]